MGVHLRAKCLERTVSPNLGLRPRGRSTFSSSRSMNACASDRQRAVPHQAIPSTTSPAFDNACDVIRIIPVRRSEPFTGRRTLFLPVRHPAQLKQSSAHRPNSGEGSATKGTRSSRCRTTRCLSTTVPRQLSIRIPVRHTWLASGQIVWLHEESSTPNNGRPQRLEQIWRKMPRRMRARTSDNTPPINGARNNNRLARGKIWGCER